jgi:hypothetical protein
LIADRGDDSKHVRARLVKRAREPIIPKRRHTTIATQQDGRQLRRYRRRGIIEWTNSWWQHFRRLIVRDERAVRPFEALGKECTMRRLVSGVVMLTLLWIAGPVAWAFECPSRITEARGAVQKAEAALAKANEMLAHAEAEHNGAGTDTKKHAEAVREARTAQGYAEDARIFAEKF